MYILFHKSSDSQGGEFIQHSQRWSKITECYIPVYTQVGIIKAIIKEAKGKRRRKLVFQDLTKDFQKEFKLSDIADAIRFGKRYFNTYNGK